MSVIVYAEINNGSLKKSALEAACYGAQVASIMGVKCHAVLVGNAGEASSELKKYGISTLYQVSENGDFNPDFHADAIKAAANACGATVVVISNSYSGKAIAPRAAIKLDASLVSNAVALPSSTNPFVVKKGVFSGKAFAFVTLEKAVKMIALTPNSIDLKEIAGGEAQLETLQVESASTAYTVTETKVQSGEIPLTEAELVVSAGRGMKGPENWGMIEELAKTLHAATACSKPVSDMDWRPHSEHVGQTGITIKPNLYIAIGISGAIQHLAGVSSSKVIVVVNKDPEAPFFKAADYGIVGDAFEVVPKLIEAAKALS